MKAVFVLLFFAFSFYSCAQTNTNFEKNSEERFKEKFKVAFKAALKDDFNEDELNQMFRDYSQFLTPHGSTTKLIAGLKGETIAYYPLAFFKDDILYKDNINNCVHQLEGPDSGTPKVSGGRKQKERSNEKLKRIPDSPAKSATLEYLSQLGGAHSIDEAITDITNKTIRIISEQLADYLNYNNIYNLIESLNEVLLREGFIEVKKDNVMFLLRDNFEEGFFATFLSALDKSKKNFFREHGIEGITLSNAHIFDLSNEENFLLKFFATLNMCNRSARRHLRNREDTELEYIIEEEHFRSWIFPQSKKIVTDNHKFSVNGHRKDSTSELGGYSKVYDIISHIKLNINKSKAHRVVSITDQDIALWIRQILQGNKLDKLTNSNGEIIETKQYPKLIEIVKSDLVKITYLLFGSEVMRNPASLIHQQMLLDLIIYAGMSWQTAINFRQHDGKEDGGVMPMSMKGAVKSARMLHKIFYNSMPKSYMYGSTLSIESKREIELLQREYYITEEWFSCIHELNHKKSRLGDLDKAKIEIILEALPRWYGVNDLWYTGDQINHLLRNYLLPLGISPMAPVPIGVNDALRHNIQEALNNLATAAVIPLNLNNNHWVGLVLRREPNGTIQAIYNDPMGNSLTPENRNILENYLREFNNNHHITITDLHLVQQTNGYDCGPITVNNLVRLALAENLDFVNRETIIQDAHLISEENQDLNLRQRHSEIFLIQTQTNGEVNLANIDRLTTLLAEELSHFEENASAKGDEDIEDKMANLGLEDKESSSNQEEELEINKSNVPSESKKDDSVSTSVVAAIWQTNQGNISSISAPSLMPSSLPLSAPTSYSIFITLNHQNQNGNFINLGGEISENLLDIL